MPEVYKYLLVGLVVCFTSFQEGVTGFGATVLALPFVTLLLGLEVAVPALFMQAWILAGLIVLEARRNIVWHEYFHILLFVVLGLPFGMWMRHSIDPYVLKWILAGFMIAIGAQGLIQIMMGKRRSKMDRNRKLLASLFLPIGGVIHGAFASGGPLVVIYATRAIADKLLFRVTMCMMWFTINTVMIVQWLLSKAPHAASFKVLALCLPFTLVGLYIGNKAHYRIDEEAFRKVVYSVLIASGMVLICSLTGWLAS